MIRKIVTAVILVPLAIVIIAFAVANRQIVTVSFDPFDAAQPAYAAAVPLFVLIFILVIFGVLLGGTAVWLRQSRWAWAARRAERESQQLRLEIERLRHGAPVASPPALVPPYRAGTAAE